MSQPGNLLPKVSPARNIFVDVFLCTAMVTPARNIFVYVFLCTAMVSPARNIFVYVFLCTAMVTFENKWRISNHPGKLVYYKNYKFTTFSIYLCVFDC